MRRYFDFTAVILIIQESEEVHDKTYAIEVSKYKAKRACIAYMESTVVIVRVIFYDLIPL